MLSGDDATVTVDLPFPVGWPFNAPTSTLPIPVVTSLTISTNGIVFGGASGSASGVESTAAFVSGPPAMAPLWDDLVATDVSFGVPYPGVAVVTWTASEVGSSSLFEMQLQIRRRNNGLDDASANTVVFVYDAAVPVSDGLVGLTRGGGATPLLADLSQGAGGLSSGTVIEVFDSGSPNDLQASSIEIRASSATTSASVQTSAVATAGREACAPVVRGLTFSPNAGGYAVSAGGSIDGDFLRGDRITVASAQNPISGPVALPFAVPMPGGGSTSTLYVDLRGRVSDDAGLTTTGIGLPTVSNLLNGPRTICPYWSEPLVSQEASAWLHQDGPSSFTLSWLVSSFTERTLVQLRMFSDGTLQFVYDFGQGVGSPAVIGLSEGGGIADPGASDLSMTPIQSAGPVIYEQFSVVLPPIIDFNERLNDGLMVLASAPQLGSNLTVQTLPTGLPFPSSAVYFLGIATGTPGFQSSLGLGFLGPLLADCRLHVDIVTPGALLATASGVPFAPVVVVSVPVIPQLIGVDGLSVQGLAIAPGATPTIRPTNEIALTFGI